ncbi:MAG: autotransporter-associated beta strand repeat-containing protein, partial [Prosthecobacter sp.]|nr:autotransporter-associated beta strand repeat-containing protein [Prosthecobacter sp.]
GTTNAPTLKMDGSNGNLSLPPALTLITSNDNSNLPAILSSAGDNLIQGSIHLTTGGFGNGNTRIKVTGGSLLLAGNIEPSANATGQVILILDASIARVGVVSGVISNKEDILLALTKAGVGTWLLSGENTYSGNTSINAGTLQIERISATGTPQPLGTASTAILLGSGTASGTLEYAGSTAATLTRNLTVAAAGGGIIRNSGGAVLTLSGTQAKNGRPLTYAGGDFRITGRIVGATAGDLFLDAANVNLTNNANTYVGSTWISNASTLIVSNTSGSATGTGTVTVDASSRLAGSGLIQAGANNHINLEGALIVGDPGASAAANLRLSTAEAGSTIFGPGSVLYMDLFSGASLRDNAWSSSAADLLLITGTLEVYEGATLKLGNPLDLTDWSEGAVFKLFDWSGLTSTSGSFTVDASELGLSAGYSFDTSHLYQDGTITLVAAIVPEPHRALLILVGVMLVTLRRYRPQKIHPRF